MEAERVGHRVELPAGEYLIRSWRPGDRIRPLGGKGSRTVAELFKEAQVSAGARKGWPVVVLAADDATLVWVPGICRSDGYVPVPGKEALDVECHLA
jgi:tRNA(Ile)-lysidine synthetase-like protein